MNIYSYPCQWCFYGAPLVPSPVDNNDESNAGSLHTAKKGGQYQRPGKTHGFWWFPHQDILQPLALRAHV